jgi:Pentapeptide repeats (8 copies)
LPNRKYLSLLKQGVVIWNTWREKHRDVQPDFIGTDYFRGANLSRVNLSEVYLSGANLSRANLSGASLSRTNLRGANLRDANLINAKLRGAILRDADLINAKLRGVNLSGADLSGAKLNGVGLVKANLSGATLNRANLTGANLSKANLRGSQLVGTILENAILVDCQIYGISAWNLKLNGAQQNNLIVTQEDEPTVTVDNLEVAQFIYLLLNNQKIRDVIDTIGKKAVLILGRFTPERKAVLEAIREKLRFCGYLPILFDFDQPASKDITETVSTLAHMARFIIADLTEPSSIAKELETIVPTLAVPVQPLLEGSRKTYSMFKDYWKYDWILKVHRYRNRDALLASMEREVIGRAEEKAKALEKKRKRAMAREP